MLLSSGQSNVQRTPAASLFDKQIFFHSKGFLTITINKFFFYFILILKKLSTYDLGPLPPSLIKMVFYYVQYDFLPIVNCSLSTGAFPDAFKTALVKPLLKKHNVDPSVLNNFQTFLFKVLEKVVFKQLNVYLMSSKYDLRVGW